MAHPQQLTYISTLATHLSSDFKEAKILEIGSYNVNGTIRDFFTGSDYIGTDLIEGPGVDLVADGHLINHEDNTYDITISCECFEHNPYWLETFLNMYRMTKAGGIVVFTCATRGRLEHGTRRTSPDLSPGTQDIGWDYYRNLLAKDFIDGVNLDDLFDTHLFLTNGDSKDLFFIGTKKGGQNKFNFDKDRFLIEYEQDQRKLRESRSFKAKLYDTVKSFVLLPTIIASYLPEQHFQTISVFYINSIRFFTTSIRKFVKSSSKPAPPQP